MSLKVVGKYLWKYSPSLKDISKKVYHMKAEVEGGLLPVEQLQYAYLCPLCLKNNITMHSNRGSYSAVFNEDHYPPRSAGGKRKILVCKPCNSTAGIDHDWTVKEYLQALSFLQGHPKSELPVKARYKGTKGNYSTSLKMNNQLVKGENVIIHEYSSKTYPLIGNWMEQAIGKKGMQVDVTFTVPSEEMVRRALLRSAYLYCFSVFGYAFAFSMVAQHLKAVINSEEKHALSNMGVFLYDEKIIVPPGLHMLTEPKELSCYTVNMPLYLKDSEYKSTACVLIPLGSQKDSSSLQPFQEVVDEKSALKCSFTPVNEHLLSEGLFDVYCNA